MRKDKQEAIKLRFEEKSYNEISRLLNIPKSTLHCWLKDDFKSKEIRNLLQKRNVATKEHIHLMNTARLAKLEKLRNDFRIQAVSEFSLLKNNPLFLSAINLYWGEGDKILKNSIVRLINTDYRIVKIFKKFLVEVCNVPEEKIKLCLFIYPDLQDDKCKSFWSEMIGIPLNQFGKTQTIIGKNKARRTLNGICSVQVYSRGLKEKVIKWIDLIAEEVSMRV